MNRCRDLLDRGRCRACRGAVLAAAGLLLLLCCGCATARTGVIEAFPPASAALPWVLQGEVWSGSFDEAAPALGNDADTWARFQPTHVWLAKYCHEQSVEHCLTVRCLAFASSDGAKAAFAAIRPAAANPYGGPDAPWDAGCWTEVGVLFQWGRLVVDVFGPEASWGSELQSALLAGFITKRMPAGAPDNPT